MNLATNETRAAPTRRSKRQARGRDRLGDAARFCALQRDDGHFVFELEADATIPAEYVLMRHYRGEPVDAALEEKIARYLRRIQSADGGWPLFHAGSSDISASVKAYFALKMIGDRVDAPHMARARAWILDHGGAANSNVFTRNLLALYGAIPWRGVPVMPVEIMLLPRWFPFHLDKVSYWARTVLVPLMVLNALKPRAVNAKGVRIDELFVTPPVGRQALAQGRASEIALVGDLRRHRPGAARDPTLFSASDPQARHRARRRVRDRAAERRGRARRDLPRHGERAPDVRCAGAFARRPEGGNRARRDREIVGDQGGRGLLPALPVARLGYRARGACAARSGRRGVRRALLVEPRMAPPASSARHGRRLGVDASRCSAGRLGLPICQSPLPRSRRHRRRGHGHGPERCAHSSRSTRCVLALNRPRAGMGRRHAEREWRLGRLRRRQRILLPERDPVRRSRRSARSPDRRRHRALRVDAGPASAQARARTTRSTRGSTTSCARRRRTAAGMAAGA